MFYKIINFKIFKRLRYKIYKDSWRNNKKLVNNNKIVKLRELFFKLQNCRIYSKKINNFLWEKNFPDHRLYLQQFFFQKLNFKKIFTTLLYFYYDKSTKIIFPLPHKWSRKLRDMDDLNIGVNSFLSNMLFIIYLIFSAIKSFFGSIILVFNVIYKKIFKVNLVSNENNHKAVICNFPTRKLNLDNEFSEFNINSWLKKNKKIENIIFIDQNIKKNRYIKKNILTKSLVNLFVEQIDLFKFINDYLRLLINVIIDIILFRYGSILLLKNLTENLLVKNSDTSNYTFFFIWTGGIERPLWTYSTINEPEILNLSILGEISHNKRNELCFDFEGWGITSWKKYNVWTNECKDYLLKRLKNKSEINVVGPIFSHDNNNEVKLPKNIISLFAYENQKWSIDITSIQQYQLLDLLHLFKFYKNILKVVENKNVFLVIKRKKELNLDMEKKYIRNFYKKLKQNPKVIYIDSKISPYKLIKNSKCVISLPFTSTSVAANYLGIKSIYYDPTTQINLDDPTSSGVKIINEIDKLDDWITEQLKI